ncbi:TonB-dependent receptor plug domain-containing protein, partial [Chryseobacterium sp. CH1]|uniref:TonB-dependent receptor plug domain-containing protein n=1 Tax=Chryseobacterium sp. CH1 TaxID=713551 RepID=UPI0010255739
LYGGAVTSFGGLINAVTKKPKDYFGGEASYLMGVPATTNGEIDPADLERLEVIKGPSGTLYGGAVTSFGGLINAVTKKPKDYFGGEASYLMG